MSVITNILAVFLFPAVIGIAGFIIFPAITRAIKVWKIRKAAEAKLDQLLRIHGIK